MKRIISIILGVFLLATPLAGCLDFLDEKPEDKATGVVMTFENDGDMSVKKDGETLVESQYSYTYHVLLKDQVNPQGTRYLLEDSVLKEEFYSVFSGKTITLEKTEETQSPKGMSVCIYVPFEKTIDFTVAPDGSIWEWAQENGKSVYYASQAETVDYEDILALYNVLDYEYPYTLKRTEDGTIVFMAEEEIVFSFNQADVEMATMGSDYDGNYAWVDDKSWLKVIFDIIFKKEISFRECVETQWNQLTNVEISLAGDNLEKNLKLNFCYGGYIYFYDRVSEKYYVSTFGVMDTTSLEALQFDWIRIQYGY